jgi:hypothetical protein
LICVSPLFDTCLSRSDPRGAFFILRATKRETISPKRYDAWKEEIMRRHFTPAAMILAILILGACSAPSQAGPSAWLDRPLDGDQVALEPLTIQAHASDAAGVSRFDFLVGDTLLATVLGSGTRFAEAKAGWVPPAPGTYVVRVRAADGVGNVGADATARILVGASALATATPTPTPAAIDTTTPTPTPAAIDTTTPTPAPAALVTLTPMPVPAACPGPPVITSFAANPTAITYGQTILFSWGAITNADDAIIDTIGHIALQGGSWQLQPPPVAATYPTKTTTFTLTAIGCGGMTTKQVTVVVIPVPPPPPPPPVCSGPPVIASFTANPSTITAGQSTTLTWGAVTNATSAIIDPDIGGVPTPSSTVVSPSTTRTYTLTATGCGGTVKKQVTIVVNPASLPPTRTQPPPPPPDTMPPSISNVSANPTNISQSGCGQTTRTTVSATVTDASGVDRVAARLTGVGGGEVPMSSVGGNVYRADIGPVGSAGQLMIRVVAWDKAGNLAQSGSINVGVMCIK